VKSDFDGGYLFNVERVVSGELFADFVGVAKTALSEDHKDVAAVPACAALEQRSVHASHASIQRVRT